MKLNVRRLPMLAVALAAALVAVFALRDSVATRSPVFSNAAAPWMPAAPAPGGLTSTWFCPGVPAGAGDRVGGEVVVFNPDADELRGTLTILVEQGDPIVQPVTVAPYRSQSFNLAELVADDLVPNGYAAAVIEIDGGGGLVEQRATQPIGTNSVGMSVAACANAPSNRWYFATGDTSEESTSILVLSNPHDHAAIVDVTIQTARGPREVNSFTVPPKSVRELNLEDSSVDDADIGVSVVATVGNLVVGRAQNYNTATRDGYSMTLGAPVARDQWWFAAGEKADDITMEYSIYNPGEDDIDVTVNPLGYETTGAFVVPDPIPVPAGEIVKYDLGTVEGLPDGPISMAFFNVDGQPFVVERILTREINGIRTSSVTPGATPRGDGYVANTWYMGIGSPDPEVAGQLTVMNINNVPGVVTVQAITASGVVTIDGLGEVALPPSATISVDLPTQNIGDALIVRSTSQVFVERVMPREDGAQGRVASWLLPAG